MQTQPSDVISIFIAPLEAILGQPAFKGQEPQLFYDAMAEDLARFPQDVLRDAVKRIRAEKTRFPSIADAVTICRSIQEDRAAPVRGGHDAIPADRMSPGARLDRMASDPTLLRAVRAGAGQMVDRKLRETGTVTQADLWDMRRAKNAFDAAMSDLEGKIAAGDVGGMGLNPMMLRLGQAIAAKSKKIADMVEDRATAPQSSGEVRHEPRRHIYAAE